MHTGTGMAGSTEGDRLIAASRVKGTSVYDSSGEKIGSIDDIMIGKVDGEVAYAVMSFGGFLGMGEKYHPLPWDALTYDTNLGGYQVGAEGERFRDAPSYDRDGFENDDWSAETDSYYGEQSSGSWLGRRQRGESQGGGGSSGSQGAGWRQEGGHEGRQSGTSFDPDGPGATGGHGGSGGGRAAGGMAGGMGGGASAVGAGAAGGGITPGALSGASAGIGGGAITGGIPLGDTGGGPTRHNVDDDRTAPYGDRERSDIND